MIQCPKSYDGKTTYEGELGIVIGKTCSAVSADEADEFIFGYTCVNDVTASDILNRDPTFPQWARAKGFDGSGPFGPVVTSGIDPAGLDGAYRSQRCGTPELSDIGHDLQRATTRQQRFRTT